jgi:hypothetical protein
MEGWAAKSLCNRSLSELQMLRLNIVSLREQIERETSSEYSVYYLFDENASGQKPGPPNAWARAIAEFGERVSPAIGITTENSDVQGWGNCWTFVLDSKDPLRVEENSSSRVVSSYRRSGRECVNSHWHTRYELIRGFDSDPDNARTAAISCLRSWELWLAKYIGSAQAIDAENLKPATSGSAKPPADPPADDAERALRIRGSQPAAESNAGLTNTERLAYFAYRRAEEIEGRKLTPTEAFAVIREMSDEDSNGYKPLSVEALGRADRRAREKRKEQRRETTSGVTTRSVVRLSDKD